MKRIQWHLVALLVSMTTLLISGCGGGGGGGPAPVTPPPPALPVAVNASAAWANLFAATRTFNVSGVGVDGASYTASVTITPGTSTGNGGPMDTITTTALVNKNGALLGNGGSTLFATPGTLVPQIYTDTSGYCAFFSNATAPTTTNAVMGQSGALFNATMSPYTASTNNCDTTTLTGLAINEIWSIYGDVSTGVAYFCVDSTNSGTSSTTESDCVQVDVAGNLGTKARVTIGNGASTIVTMTGG